MNSFDSTILTILTIIWAIPFLICLIAIFADDDWETIPLLIISLFPIINLFGVAIVVSYYCGAFKNKKTKVKETIEDKYDRLTKEAYDA